MKEQRQSRNIMIMMSLFIILSCSISLTSGKLQVITRFNEIADLVKGNPNSLSAIMVSRLDQCERCKVGNKVFEEYADLTEGVVLSYLVDCEKVWQHIEDQVRIPACDPEKKQELPHITFFQPEVNELDIYNKKNKKQPKDIPYQGMVSPDALLQKSKELLPSFIKTIANVKELDAYLRNKEISFKLMLFSDEEQTPLFLRALSGQFRGQADFGLVDADNKKMKKRYGITQYPKIVALKLSGTDYERIDYDGELTVQAVSQFLQTQLDQIQAQSGSSQQKSNQGVYFDIPEKVEVLSIKANQIPISLRKYKENFIVLHLHSGQPNTVSSKIFERIQNDIGNMFKYYSVNCSQEECEKIYGGSLKQYPAVVVYNISAQRKLNEYVLVDKYIDKDELAENLLNSVSYASLVESEVDNETEARKKIKEGTDNKKSSVVLAHDKFDYYHKLVFYVASSQLRFRKYLNFVRFVNPTKEDLQTWSISGTPGVVTVLEVNDFKNTVRRAPYEQKDFEYKNLVDYLNQMAISKQDEVVEEIKIEEITKQEDLEEKCLNNKDKPCVIALVDLAKEGKFKLDLEKLHKIKKLYADRDYSYHYIDTRCHKELQTYFKLNENSLNSLVFLNSSKTKFRLLSGAFEVDNLVSFMDELNGKKPKGLVSLPSSIDLDERDCAAFNVAEKQKLEQERNEKRQNKYKQKVEL